MLNGMETNRVMTYWKEETWIGFGPWSHVKKQDLGSIELDPNNLPNRGDYVKGKHGLWKVTDKIFFMEDGSWNFIVTNITRYKDTNETIHK